MHHHYFNFSNTCHDYISARWHIQLNCATSNVYHFFCTFWSVKEYIFPIIWADIFLVSVFLSWKALSTTGMIRASEGASIKWTNLVSSNVCRHTSVFFAGSCRASSNTGTMAEIIKNLWILHQNVYLLFSDVNHENFIFV